MSNPVDNIQIRQTWLEDEVSGVAEVLAMGDDEAFMYFVTSLLLEVSPEDVDQEDIVDGSHDKQIDVIHIEDDPDQASANIIIVQCKNSTGFGSNDVIKIKNGLDWIFERPKADLENLKNKKFFDKIKEIRNLRKNYGMSNLSVSVFHATAGNASKEISSEYQDEANGLVSKYENAGFKSFLFDQLGAYEIIEMLTLSDMAKKKVDIEFPIVYDANQPSIIRYVQGDTKSILCTVTGETLATIANSEPRDSIFDLNVRPHYGSRGKVNRDVYETCTGDGSERFWFLNNGITLICDKCDFNSDPDDPRLKITNAQIVNGCQTSVTVREASDKKELKSDVKVLMRVYATDNPILVQKITLTTNNQNKITDRDLKANDVVQRDIEIKMHEKYQYFYERKNRQYRNFTGQNRSKIVPSPKAAQAYLAIVRKTPSVARNKLNAIWSDFYSDIFSNATIDDLLLAFKIYRYCQKRSFETSSLQLKDADIGETRVFGMFHIARVIGYRILADKWGNSNIKKVENAVRSKDFDALMKPHYAAALKTVTALWKSKKRQNPIAGSYFKTRQAQESLNAILYAKT